MSKIFRKILGKRIGRISYFFFWFIVLDRFVRPPILKMILGLSNRIMVSAEKEIYLKNLIANNPTKFFLDFSVLPFAIGIAGAYLIVWVIPTILTIKNSSVFKE